MAEHSAYHTIAATMLVFVAGLLLNGLSPHAWTYFCAAALLGFGNAGCRVARSALVLNIVPNDVMGRVTVFYNVFDRILRTSLVGALGIIDYAGPRTGFLLLFAVAFASYVGVLRSRRSIKPSADHLLSSSPAI